MSGVYTLRELTALLGYKDRDSFRLHRRRIEAQGFPAPLPGSTHPLKWSRAQVDAWLENPRPAQKKVAEQKPGAPAPIDELSAARARIRARLGQEISAATHPGS
jgi:predicted DNA-binding transcriptional regulator AlpA